MAILRKVALALAFTLICNAAGAAATRYDSMFVFGDSYSDTGFGYVDGNGPTAVAYMAQNLGIPFTYAGAPNSFRKGLNFAVSGAQTGSSPGIELKTGEYLGYGMLNQICDFQRLLQGGWVSFNPATTLFFIAGGLNDRNIASAETVTNITEQFEALYSVGARHFELALLPTQIPPFTAVATRLNPVYESLVPQLQDKLPGSHIRLSGWGTFYDAILLDPAKYGFTNTTDTCAGRELFNQYGAPCATPDTYFYYHSGHPSTAAHKIVGKMLSDEVVAAAASEPDDRDADHPDRGAEHPASLLCSLPRR
jgi:phospholipase/lecithinase/hemolysin